MVESVCERRLRLKDSGISKTWLAVETDSGHASKERRLTLAARVREAVSSGIERESVPDCGSTNSAGSAVVVELRGGVGAAL